MKTAAIFLPFDLFGSAGTASGAELLADALRELLEDNRREQIPTRALAYAGQVRMREVKFETLRDLQAWRKKSRQLARRVFAQEDFLYWITGNHLGVLPVYEELAQRGDKTLVLQFDAHLDIYNLSDCTSELSHGNFLCHSDGPLPEIINLGARELLLRPEYIRQYYRETFAAADLAIDPEPALRSIRAACGKAEHVFLDIDCDVFDPAFFPAVTHPLPFGLTPALFLRLLDAAWSERVIGVALSEFCPAHDRHDQSLATLLWLLEYLLLKRHEPSPLPSLPRKR